MTVSRARGESAEKKGGELESTHHSSLAQFGRGESSLLNCQSDQPHVRAIDDPFIRTLVHLSLSTLHESAPEVVEEALLLFLRETVCFHHVPKPVNSQSIC